MRFTALIPTILLITALVLTFLCLFAGSQQSFLQDYPIVTLNTSRIGQNVFNTTETTTSSNPITNFIHNLTNTIESKIQDKFTSFAQDLGLHDWYGAHLMTYCEGTYLPGPVPNATLPASDITQNVTGCSNRTALFTFDPREALQRELNASGHANINLTDLNWPTEIDDGVNALRTTARAGFVLYCIAIGLIFLSLVFALLGVCAEGRFSALLNIVLEWFAFLAVGIASALATAVGVKAADAINKYGNRVGVEATSGRKFMAITWAATGCVLVAMLVWCGLFIVGRRKGRTVRKGEKGKY